MDRAAVTLLVVHAGASQLCGSRPDVPCKLIFFQAAAKVSCKSLSAHSTLFGKVGDYLHALCNGSAVGNSRVMVILLD